jgi:DNA-binding transcriptional LysR family regulator
MATNMIKLSNIHIFVKVIEAGSFVGASKQLGYPRSTVSRKVSQLEDSLGVRLIQRSTRKLGLTALGREYYLMCRSALTDIDRANQLISETQTNPSGVLRITAPLAAQRGFICRWITEFLGLNRNIVGEILFSDENIDLIAEGVDIAFRAGELKNSSLVARKLGDSKHVLCSSPDYLHTNGPVQSLKQLKEHDCIVYGSAQQDMTWRLNANQETHVLRINSRVIVNSMEFALEACLASLGIALLPMVVAEKHISEKRLEVVMEEYSSDPIGLYVVYPTKRNLSIAARVFLDFIIAKSKDGLPSDKPS